MTPTCIVCGAKVNPHIEVIENWMDAARPGFVMHAHSSHSKQEIHEALYWVRAAILAPTEPIDPDRLPMELAHPYDPVAERQSAAEARANAQTATLIAGKTRATRVVHDLAPSDDPTAILDAVPCRWCMESGVHLCSYRAERRNAFEAMTIRVARLDSAGNPVPGTMRSLQGAVVHHIDGDRLNNHPDNLFISRREANPFVQNTTP